MLNVSTLHINIYWMKKQKTAIIHWRDFCLKYFDEVGGDI